MAELASPARDEPASVSTPLAHVSWQSDPADTARGLMTHLYEMVDIMLRAHWLSIAKNKRVNCSNGSLCRFVLSNKAT